MFTPRLEMIYKVIYKTQKKKKQQGEDLTLKHWAKQNQRRARMLVKAALTCSDHSMLFSKQGEKKTEDKQHIG